MFTIKWINKKTNFIKSQFDKALGDGVRDTLLEYKKDFEKATGGFHPPPTFIVGKNDITTTSKKFLWLEHGTRIRRRVMSKDWQSKTTPGSLQSGSGAGKALGFGSRPGIEPRNWWMASTKRQKASGQLPGLILRRLLQRGRSMFR